MPGILLLLLVSLLSTSLTFFLPPFVGRVALAVLLGILINNLFHVPEICRFGIKLGLKRLLQLAIILLGASIDFSQILSVGGLGLFSILFLIVFTFSMTSLLGRLFGISLKRQILIGVGMAICGNTAVAATAPLIEANEEDIILAVSMVTLFGTLAVFLYPLLGLMLGMTDLLFGAWAGTAINDTSQVVAAGFSFSEEAGQAATIFKLTRNVLMAPVILLLGCFYRRTCPVEDTRDIERMPPLLKLFPAFILGFLLMASMNSLDLIPLALGEAMQILSRFLILLALSGIGLSVDMKSLRRMGYTPFLLGLSVAISLALASYLLNSFLFFLL